MVLVKVIHSQTFCSGFVRVIIKLLLILKTLVNNKMATLTKRQKQIYDFICSFSDRHKFSPTVREIGKHFRISPATAQEHKDKLVGKGLLNRDSGLSRGIELNNMAMVKIPLLGTIAAGQPIEAIQQMELIAIPQNRIPPSAEVYALRVVGNSMIDENINDGDVILVKQQATAENGQKVVALIDNHEATLKKYYRERGRIRLQPDNKSMEPIILRNGRGISIQGIVLDIIRDASTIGSIVS
ncbi:MAG: transcriptional repressor LexA, partial [Candidatus Harrisonbacteria bacterium]|nr:transcriptional repressor LexA [Candidatus Harrisonbacteria bacterium]